MHSTSKIEHLSSIRWDIRVPLSSITKPSPGLRHPWRGWLISVGACKSWMMQAVVSVLVRLMTLGYRDCPTIREALTQLKPLDPSLPTWNLSTLGLPLEGKGASV